MSEYILVWDLETVRDLDAARRVHGLAGKSDADVRAFLGTEFAKLPLHEIVCIGSLLARRSQEGWEILKIEAPHKGVRPEADLIRDFVGTITSLRPRIVTYNGTTFDLPVLRYRSMLHRIAAPGLHNPDYFRRASDSAIDLCEALAGPDLRDRVRLDLLCKTLRLRGKPGGIDGSKVETFVVEGKIREVAEYCEADIVNTYRIWLLYEFFRGGLTDDAWKASGDNLNAFIAREDKAYLQAVIA